MTSIDDAINTRPSLKFPDVGTKYVGDILDTRQHHVRDFDTGEPQYWDDDPDKPMMQWVIGLRTDDGDFDWYVKPAAWAALKKAVKDSGGKLSQGGRITVVRIDDGEPKKKGLNPPHQFDVEFAPASPVDDAIDAD